MRLSSIPLVLVVLLEITQTEAFQPLLDARPKRPRIGRSVLHVSSPNNDDDPGSDYRNSTTHFSRRDALVGLATAVTVTTSLPAWAAGGVTGYRPAVRPTAYRVDSTIPPTLLPLNARQEGKILADLGRGSGTNKEQIVVDTINLNNILNKAVFGTINTVSSLVGPKRDESNTGPGSASFVCLGVPKNTTTQDIDLALGLLKPMVQARKSKDTALGLFFVPYSAQPILDQYIQGIMKEDDLNSALRQAGVDDTTLSLYAPLLQFAQSQSLDLLALSPELQDVETVRRQGLQNVDPERRSRYVVDPNGFIALPQDERFKLYADRSLFKDYTPLNAKDSASNFFSERILVHEAAATAVSQYAARRPESFVALVANIPDVRFLNGINGRIPRICQFLNPTINKVTNNAVTTILLNPTAKETLSKTRYLRLEIGTAPETLEYQSKVSDYLWFSQIPKVNMLPRLMNG